MKLALFFLKYSGICTTVGLSIVSLSDKINGYFEQLPFTWAFLAACATYLFHEGYKKYEWEDDYMYLLSKTTLKKISSNIKKSKSKMRDELNDE